MISIIRRKKRAVKGKTKKIKPKIAIGSPGCVCCFCAQGFCTAPPRGARGPGNSTAQPPARRRAAGVRHCARGGEQTPRRTARRGARLCHAFPAPRPRPLCAKGARGPHTGHRPALPASPLCPSALPGQGRHPGSAKPRARPAARARGETYLPLAGRGARLIFWLQGPQNPRPQALR